MFFKDILGQRTSIGNRAWDGILIVPILLDHVGRDPVTKRGTTMEGTRRIPR